jgi:hypothetical protein
MLLFSSHLALSFAHNPFRIPHLSLYFCGGLLDFAREFISKVDVTKLWNGEWFTLLLTQVFKNYNQNANVSYLQRKYPGEDPQRLANRIIRMHCNQASLLGIGTGAAKSAVEIAYLILFLRDPKNKDRGSLDKFAKSNAGKSAAALPVVSAHLTNMVALGYIQIRLVIDLINIYDKPIDWNDPEDVQKLIFIGLGIVPSHEISKLMTDVVKYRARKTVEDVVTDEIRKNLQIIGKEIGLHLLQSTVLAIALPVASIGTNALFNWASTRAIGLFVKQAFYRESHITKELNRLINPQKVYPLVVPVTIKYMIGVNAVDSPEELDLYSEIIQKMSVENHENHAFDNLLRREVNILDALGDYSTDEEMIETIMGLLILMAVIEGTGTVHNKEWEFLESAASALNTIVDKNKVEEKAKSMKISLPRPFWSNIKAQFDKLISRFQKYKDLS